MLGDFFSAFFLFIVIVSVLVLLHEAGHFFAARFFGVCVDEFGLGFPPRIVGWKFGKTCYTINWLPFGGFVRLKGEQGDDRKDADSFATQHVVKRLVILLAGVCMNFVTAIALFAAVFMIGLPQAIDDEHIAAATDVHIQIMDIVDNSPAKKAGLQVGDILQSLDGSGMHSREEVQAYIASHSAKPIRVQIDRKGTILEKEISPERVEGQDRPMIGIAMERVGILRLPFFAAIASGFQTTLSVARQIFSSLAAMFTQWNFSDVSGPVGIASYSLTAWRFGFATFLSLMAQLSVSLAVLNVLPIPALDGGRAIFTFAEMIRRKSLREEVENAIHMVGFVVLIVLLLVITFRDVLHLFRGTL